MSSAATGFKLALKPFDLRLAYPWALARTKAASVAPVAIVELSNGDGLFGFGEAAPVARYSESPQTVSDFVSRVSTQRLSFEEWRASVEYVCSLTSGNFAAKSAVVSALLDGAARLARKPLHSFLGLEFSNHLHTTSFTIGIDQPEIIRQKTLAASGHSVLKMKLGSPQDAVNLAALRDVAPQKPLRVDANEAWDTREQALEKLNWLADDGRVQFVEQPMPASTPPQDFRWLKERSPLPIFADESYLSVAHLSSVADCFHGVNVKLTKTGGVIAAKEALEAARRAGLKTMIGCMIETSVGISAAAHLAALCDYLDLDGNLLITNDPYQGVTLENGYLSFASAREPFGLQVSPR